MKATIQMHHSSEFLTLSTWINNRAEETAGTKVYLVAKLCKKMPQAEFIQLVKLYIDYYGGQEVEFNQDYSAIRIYGKRESFLNIK